MAQIYTPSVLPPAQEGPSYHRRPLDDPYLPTRPHSPKNYSPTSSNVPRGGSGWESPRPRSPMSDPNRRDMHGRPPLPREQLPPISSLFAPALQQNNHSTSPYSEGPSPVYPSPSQDSRSPHAAYGPAERHLDTAQFRRPSVPAYSWSPRSEHVERPGYQAPPRAAPLETRQESPRYDTHYHASEKANQPQSSPSRWSAPSEQPRNDYFPPRDTSSSFTRPTTSEQYRPVTQQPSHRPEHESQPRIIFCDPPSNSPAGNSNVNTSSANNNTNSNNNALPATSDYPPTPAVAPTDPVMTKDGLGPKIWTGTHFLPRFVRQAEVPGEGLCYFYDDGSHCKTVIDGEVVNAHWGVTKAGKPRKRLAIACITCREKKIKCDPDFPRCVQCEKFGRVCKFKNAPRGGGGQGSPDTPPDDADEPPRPASSRADNASFRGEKRANGHQSPSRHGSPESDMRSTKRRRHTGYSEYTPVPSEASPRTVDASPSANWVEPNVNRPIDHSIVRDWQVNPYSKQPALMNELLTMFFKHIPETAYSFFPETPFRTWISSPAEKSLDDLMVIYAVLALSTIFAANLDHKNRAVRFAAIARYASDNRHFSIQLVQTRLMLSLYYFANNNPNDAWDYCGAGLRAASGLKLNLEMEKTYDNSLRVFPYGLDRHGYAECRRRTFWSCFMMDRLNGFCSGNLTTINTDDIFLRLPCNTKSFDQQLELRNPFFQLSELPPPRASGNTLGRMAYMVHICSIWGDIMARIYRASQLAPISATDRLDAHHPRAFSSSQEFYKTATERLDNWRRSLPPDLVCSSENFAKALDRGRIGMYTMMHAMYYISQMRLHRFHDGAPLPPNQVSSRIATVREHAHTFVGFIAVVSARRLSPHTALCAPFVGFAIASAVDVLTANFVPSSLPQLLTSLKGAQVVLSELAQTWQSARNQQAQVGQRIRELVEISKRGPARNADGTSGVKGVYSVSRTGMVYMENAIDNTFHYEKSYDLVYHG
ncbi:fungal-specific transcription factor domain-containing protein [Xylogone sp. PMI_703]|nr:fungal-specific transcription factor domain-containing protein [Xylogone sp. PMI_703]